jgi:hypothetical protein
MKFREMERLDVALLSAESLGLDGFAFCVRPPREVSCFCSVASTPPPQRAQEDAGYPADMRYGKSQQWAARQPSAPTITPSESEMPFLGLLNLD